MRYTVGIVGYGFVGESQAYAFAPIADIKVYDIDEKKCTHSLEDVLNQQFVFICLPTPMLENGKQDISLIDNFFKQIEYYDTPDTIFIIKSTVLPGTTDELLTTYWRKIVFCPEFLTEKNAKLDMLTQPRIILGGNRIWLSYVQELFEARFGNKHYILTDSTSAEIIKYMCNNFLSVKVSFVNEFYDLVETVGADWDSVIEGFVSAFPTDISKEDFVSWEVSTADGTLDGKVNKDGKYAYITNMTIMSEAVKLGAEEMLLGYLFAKCVSHGVEYGYFVSRIPSFKRWSRRNQIDQENPIALKEAAENYVKLRRRNGKRRDPELSLYESLGYGLERTVQNAFKDEASLNFGVVCRVDNPFKNRFTDIKPIRLAVGGLLSKISNHPKILKKVI